MVSSMRHQATSLRQLLSVAAAAWSVSGADADRAPPHPLPRPSLESAQANAHRIFNAVSHAGRQWGSALNHNGFSFFPAIIPAGMLLYRGSEHDYPPPAVDWLAFEIEHAEQYGASWTESPRQPRLREGKRPSMSHESRQQTPLRRSLSRAAGPSGHHGSDKHAESGGSDHLSRNHRGYFHTYQASRDLAVLYVDRMSAAKTTMGTLDSQDAILRENMTGDVSGGFMDEPARAADICHLIQPWGYAGLVRMEAGFEAVHCNFSSGLRFLSARRTYLPLDKVGDGRLHIAQWARAVAQRYDGLGADRLRIDFSSMVSGFFFPINFSSTDPSRLDLVRLASADLQELRGVKRYLSRVASQPRRFTVDWQAVTDMIVRRFSERLAFMASGAISDVHFINEVESALLIYEDAPSLPGDMTPARGSGKDKGSPTLTEACTQHFMLAPNAAREQWTEPDRLIHAAIESVMRDTCRTLLSIRARLVHAAPARRAHGERLKAAAGGKDLAAAVASGRRNFKHLARRLAWSEWRKTRRCPLGEIMFSAMWPLGNEEDYWNPGCRAMGHLNATRHGYWTD